MTADASAGPDFEKERPRLLGIAYRMLGSAHDAEDLVQDTCLRWLSTERSEIETPAAWLTTVLTRLCLTRLTSARVRRESYVGPWLPEPVLTPDPVLGPAETAEQRDSVSLALLVAMERLHPPERAVYVLRTAFGYRHREIAAVLGRSESSCRQLDRRARRKLTDAPPAPPSTDRASWHRLVELFLGAAREGDLPALEALLADQVTSWSDGGGAVSAARRPIHGRAAVARYLVGIANQRNLDGLGMEAAEVNCAPALLAWARTRLTGVLVLELGTSGEIRAIRVLVNPPKIDFLSRRHAPLSRSGGLLGQS